MMLVDSIWRVLMVAAVLAAIGAVLASPEPAIGGGTLNVTRFDDPEPDGCAPSNCSLREAIIDANVDQTAETINVPAGDYRIEIPGAAENDGLTGDFDITNPVSIVGAGSGTTSIDAQMMERIFDLPVLEEDFAVSIRGLTLQNGLTASGGHGGGIRNAVDLTLDDVRVMNNSAGGSFGGGLVVEGGTAVINNSQFIGNSSFSGGGISTFGGTNVEITNSQFIGNTSGNGGGISLAGTGSLSDSIFRSNEASFGGGGILSYGGNFNPDGFTMQRILVAQNSAGNRGGGMDLAGINHISQASIYGNTAGVQGGGINNGGTLLLTNATISNNTTQGSGGGLYHTAPGTIESEFLGVTVAGNRANTDADDTDSGGGVFMAGMAKLAIRGTIIAGNLTAADPNDCVGKPGSSNYNLVGTLAGGCTFAPKGTDFIEVDARLTPFVDVGTYASGHGLLPNSPALDTFTGCTPPTIDQRGILRPQQAECDIGAIEQQPGFVWGDNDCSGLPDARDALFGLLHESGAEPVSAAIEGCPDVGSELGGNGNALTWGDVDCSGDFGAGDTLLVLAYVAAVAAGVPVPGSCPDIGDLLTLP